jgi:choice-of-anchor C domain-containing protein
MAQLNLVLQLQLKKLLAFTLLFSAFNLNAQTIINGSFEESVVPATEAYTNLIIGSSFITGWEVDKGEVDYVWNYWKASEGDYSIDLNGLTTGAIWQTIKTEKDSSYTVTFDLSGNPVGGDVLRVLQVSAGDKTRDIKVMVTGNTQEDMKWKRETLTFTAFDTVTVLRFESLAGEAYGPAIDNVSISKLKEDCNGVLGGTALLDSCGTCLQPDDPKFAIHCNIEAPVLAFSPDHETFKFTLNSSVKHLSMLRIYNRWGEKMYEPSKESLLDNSYGWDGSGVQGGKAPAGTYFYMLEAVLTNGETIELQGTVTLIR